jgi:hypothetical protein
MTEPAMPCLPGAILGDMWIMVGQYSAFWKTSRAGWRFTANAHDQGIGGAGAWLETGQAARDAFRRRGRCILMRRRKAWAWRTGARRRPGFRRSGRCLGRRVGRSSEIQLSPHERRDHFWPIAHT